VELYHLSASGGVTDRDHGMTEVKKVPITLWRSTLCGRQVYPITSVYHSIHLVLKDGKTIDDSTELYINNTADFETYNYLWNGDWEEEAARVAVASKRRQIEKAKRSSLSQQDESRKGRGGIRKRGRLRRVA